MASVFQEKAMRMQVLVGQAGYKAVRGVTMHDQGLQKEVRVLHRHHQQLGALFWEVKHLKIGVPVVDDACEEPASKIVLRSKDVRGLDEPISQTNLSARVVQVMVEKYLSAILSTTEHMVGLAC